ncbi:MAG: hypothetical protein AB197_00495 [Parcubacteria bacterium C7867-002]|nr:MAG: hypothetical protein AB197_00495 [Parcubacteria bacterium C7867-002]
MTPLNLFLILLPFGLLVIGLFILRAFKHYRLWQAHLMRKEVMSEHEWKDEVELFHSFKNKGIDLSYTEYQKLLQQLVACHKIERDISTSLVEPHQLRHAWYRLNNDKKRATAASHADATYS